MHGTHNHNNSWYNKIQGLLQGYRRTFVLKSHSKIWGAVIWENFASGNILGSQLSLQMDWRTVKSAPIRMSKILSKIAPWRLILCYALFFASENKNNVIDNYRNKFLIIIKALLFHRTLRITLYDLNEKNYLRHSFFLSL